MTVESPTNVARLAALPPGERRAVLASLDEDQRAVLGSVLTQRTPQQAFDLFGYEPQPKQWKLHALPAWSEGGPFDVLWGGSSGGGKSWALLHDGLAWAWRYDNLEVWLVRATYPQLEDSFLKALRAKNFYRRELGTDWHDGKHDLKLPNGSTLKFRHARTKKDAQNMLSADCQLLIPDERTTLLPEVLDLLMSRIRSGNPRVPVVGVRSGSNPLGIGHMDCKKKFIDPAPLGMKPIVNLLPATPGHPEGVRADRYFIPAKIADNAYLDDSYFARLSMLPPMMRLAYQTGDWTMAEGQAFSDFHIDQHVVEPRDCPIPKDSMRACGLDYGLVHPFSAHWGARLGDNTIVVYRELHQSGLTPQEQAEMVIASEAPWERAVPRSCPVYVDPSTWARQPNSPKSHDGNDPPPGSIAATYKNAGLYIRRANNDRVLGKSLFHAGFRIQRDDRPRLLIYSTCTKLIEQLGYLQTSTVRPEDVQKTNADSETGEGGDDAWDSARYLLCGITGKTRGKTRTYGEELRTVRAGSRSLA